MKNPRNPHKHLGSEDFLWQGHKMALASAQRRPCVFLTKNTLAFADPHTKIKDHRSRTCDKAGSPWAVLGETAWQIDSAVPFFCFHLFCLCFCAFLRNLLSLRYFCSRRHGFQGVGAFMFYVVFVTRLPGCSISGVSRVNSCSVSAGF